MKRVVVVGTTGSGKTTFATGLAERLNLPYVQLDALYWRSEWRPVADAEFRARVSEAVEADRWVIDGNYSRVRELIWGRASHVVWLNYSFARVMHQLLKRSLRRALFREELFSGNRESFRRSFLSRDSILLWGLRTYHRRRRQYSRIITDREYPAIEFVILRSPRQAENFLQSI